MRLNTSSCCVLVSPPETRRQRDGVAGQQRHRMQPEQCPAGDEPDHPDRRHRRGGVHDDAGRLGGQQPPARNRHGQQVAKGAAAGCACDGVSGDHADEQRKQQRQRDRQCREHEEQPVGADLPEELRPVAVGSRRRRLDCHTDREWCRGEQREQREVAPPAEHHPDLAAQQTAGGAASGGRVRRGVDVPRGRVQLSRRHRIPRRSG